ncbi:hypothetical protein [Bradyrhizobium sp. AZCC 2289]|uniref:hypothetical protein n=1 Tax=Bradyrhizobium sp. AZCC 2289 TaxID=3117026 RepID=UPI002FEEF77D
MSLIDTAKQVFSPAPSPQRPRQRPDDVVELYHGHAVKRLIELRRKSTDLRALAMLPGEELNALMRRRTAVKNRRTEVAGRRPIQVDALAEIDAELALIESNIAELQQIKADRDQAANCVTQLVKGCEDYGLDHLLTCAVSLHTIKAPSFLKGENEATALARVRNEINDINADISDVKAAPLPSAEAKQKARDHVSGLIEAGRIDVSGLLRRSGGGVQWPTVYGHREIDIQPVLAFICSDQIIAKLESEIDLLADDERALSDAQCATKLKVLLAKRLELERDEEELYRMAESKGFAVSRRPDADIRAVLGLASTMPAPR